MVPLPQPSRRAVLAAAAGCLGALAGCTGGNPGRSPSTTATTDGTPAPANRCLGDAALADRKPHGTLAAGESVEGTAGDCPQRHAPAFERFCQVGSSRFCEDRDPPPERIVCSPAAGDAPLRMIAEASRLDLPGRIGFTVRNGTDATFQTNVYHWHLWKRHEGRWYNVGPSMYPQPLTPIGPSEIHHYCLELDNSSAAGRHLHGRASPVERPSDNAWNLSIPALGGGEYAFGLFGELDSEDRETGVVARFSLAGDPVEVTRTGHLADVTHDGETVTGDWTFDRDADGGEPHEFELRRVNSDTAALAVLPERLLRIWSRKPIRDMVALSREFDADVVRVRTWNYAMIGLAPPPVPFEYDGQIYETSVRAL